MLQVERKIRSRVKRQMEKTQREYYLNEQLKAIQKELGEGEEGRDEMNELEDRIRKAKLSKEAREKAQAEVKKLRSMSPDVGGSHRGAQLSRLDAVACPGARRARSRSDIVAAETVLNDDHFGLEKVKERILEYLAVQQRVGKMKGPILCLVGPPGVGKTSLGKSIAKATGREYRPHEPGRHARRGGNPRPSPHLYRLDARQDHPVDEEGEGRPIRCSCWTRSTSWAPTIAAIRRRRCWRCWTPSRTHAFNDHYLEVDFDLSDVMFVTTANSLHMPQPLMDRMEIIRIPGYTEDEKVEIAKRHLIPKQLKAHGLKDGEWSITDDGLRDLIRYYTREAGVRNLERETRQSGAQGGEGDRLQEGARRSKSRRTISGPMPACASTATARWKARTRSASSPVWPGPKSAAKR